MRKRILKVFVDFDGTITLQDIGEAIFRKFGCEDKTNKIVEDLLSDKISSRQCWDELCDSVENVDRKKLDDFVDSLEVDPTFVPFVKFCNDNEIELIALSDGFDFYIKRLFSKAGLIGLK
jgi:HAD superfamily phosphoserine phosphatase-like hydrolase